MKIFVTGADGQLGMSLRKIAGEYPGYGFVFTDLPEGDVTDRWKMWELVEENEPDLIVNCAAYTAVDRAEQEPEEAAAVNSYGAGNMAEIAATMEIPLVHISTDYVFGGTASEPVTEEDRPDPRSVYGQTKIEGDMAVRAWRGDAAVIRTSWLYSEFGHNFVKTMLRLGACGDGLRVVDDQAGCPTYATDLARAIIQIAEKGIREFEVYNYCNGGQTTWYGFAREIFRQAGMDVEVRPVSTADYPTAARRPAYSVLDTAKIQRAGIVVPEWREALGRCLRELGR